MSTLKRKIATRRPPEGIDLVRETIERFEEQLREAVNEDHSARRRNELTWRITRLNWEKCRFVYDLYWKKKAISRELYDWLVREKIVDGPLMSKWRKQGYEKLCSLSAIGTKNTNFGTTSICRVPLAKRASTAIVPTAATGCVSCCSCDKGTPIWWNTPLPEEDEEDEGGAEGGTKRKADEEPEMDEETATRLRALQGL